HLAPAGPMESVAPIRRQDFVPRRRTGGPPGAGANARAYQTNTPVSHGNLNASRVGARGAAAVARSGVLKEGKRLRGKDRSCARLEHHAINPSAASEHCRKPVARITVIRTTPHGGCGAEVNASHPPGAARAAGAIAAPVFLGKEDRVGGAV